MTKNDYLNSLRRELSGFSKEELDDVIRDQEEYINDAIASGRSEEEVIKSLGYSSSLARELKASYHLKSAEDNKGLFSKTESTMNVVFALCVLAPFNLIFVLGPFLAMCGTLFSLWVVGFTFVATSVVLLFASLATVFMGPLIFVGSFFGALGLIGCSLLFDYGCYIVTLGFLKVMVWYSRKNLEFIQGK